jgi:putative DNA primase/helicase
MLRAALDCLSKGWSVFPLIDKRTPHVKWKDFQSARPSEQQVLDWWMRWPDALIGVALGRASNLVRIDADSDGAIARLEELGLPPTAHFISPSGGHGYLLRYLDGLETEVLWKGEGVHEELRIQSDGAYTVVPPSAGYAWVDTSPPAKVPQWLYDRTVERVLQALVKELRPTLKQPERGEIAEALGHIDADDYDRWVQVGMALKATGDEYLDLWIRWSKQSSKFQEGECERKWNSFRSSGIGLTARSIVYWAEQKGYRSPNRHEAITELGNARMLSRMAEGKILHSHVWDWLYWDGARWSMDGAKKVVVELQKEVLAYRLARATDSLNRAVRADRDDTYVRRVKQKSKIIGLIRRHEDEHKVAGARSLAESEPSLSCDYRKFNRDPYFFNCPNGTLDLRTRELRPHDPQDMLTQVAPTPYDPCAECPAWEKFLAEVFDGDRELISWIQRLLGYCLTASCDDHVLPILHGTGRNGKSTLIKTVLHVMGPDYACTAPSGYLTKTINREHPTKLVVLYGKRLVVDMETEEGAKLDEELIKRITGGDEISARRMHENYWTFDPTHKLCMCTNYEPRVRGADTAIWSRIQLVPFLQTFDGDRKDTRLPSKLMEEATGILRWMVDGCTAWQLVGLGDNGSIKGATETYRGEQDTVGGFFRERCEICEQRIRKSEVTAAYKQYCQANRVDQQNPKSFGNLLAKLGVKSDETGKYYTNLKLV